MIEPTTNELIRQFLDGYRVLMMELRSIRLDKNALLHNVIAKTDNKKLNEVYDFLKSLIYERRRT